MRASLTGRAGASREGIESMTKPAVRQGSRWGWKGWIATAVTPLGAIAVLLLLVLGAGAASACHPPPTQSQTTLITLPEIDAIAATPSVVYTAGVVNCSDVWAINAWGGVSLYANVSVAPGECTEGSLVVAPYSNCTTSWSEATTDLSVAGSDIADWGHGGGGQCKPCGAQFGEALYYVVGGVLYRITQGGSNVTEVASFNVPYGTAENLGLAYDQVGNFSHDLIVTSSSAGQIWLVNVTSGNVSLFLQLGTYIAGPAIAPIGFGAYGGDLFLAEKKHGTVVVVTPGGSVSTLADWTKANAVAFPSTLTGWNRTGGHGGCGGGGGSGACTFGSNRAVFFVANFTSGALEAFSASDFANFTGLGFVSGGENHGIAGFSATGATTVFATGTQRIGDIAFITCPPSPCGSGGGGGGGW